MRGFGGKKQNILKLKTMKILQLFSNGKELLGSDGIMYIDGRFNLDSIMREVNKRNARFSKNFPHKIADSFAVYTSGRIGGALGRIITL